MQVDDSLCVGAANEVLLGSPTGLITLVLTILHHPLLFEEIPTQLTSSRKNFGRRCRGDITKIYQVRTRKLSSTCIYFICHLPLIFISPTSKTILQKTQNKITVNKL